MTLPQPSRDEFAPHVIYVGGLAIFAGVVCLISPPDSILVLCAVVGVAYAILFPPLGIWWYQRKRVRFFRCPHCGDYFRRERHFEDVIWTGRCACCKKQVLRDFADNCAA
jgi:hypothetical protein